MTKTLIPYLSDSETSSYIWMKTYRVRSDGWQWFEQHIKTHDGNIIVEQYGLGAA